MPLFRANSRSLLFVHIPKTGGSSLVKALSDLCTTWFSTGVLPESMAVSPQHMPIDDLRAVLPDAPWDIAVAVVRNPYDRLESEYRYRTKAQRNRFGETPTFAVWVDRHLSRAAQDPTHLDNHLRPQVSFVDEDVQLHRYEDGLRDLADDIAGHLDIACPIELPRLNEGGDHVVEWTARARLACNNFFADDFALLGYERTEPSYDIATGPESDDLGAGS